MIGPASHCFQTLPNQTQILDHVHSCWSEEPSDLSPFIESKELDTLRENYSKPSNRYLRRDGTVDTNEIKNSDHKDCIFRTYEQLLGILPLVNGESSAAFGDFSALQNFASQSSPPSRTNSVNGRILSLPPMIRWLIPSSVPCLLHCRLFLISLISQNQAKPTKRGQKDLLSLPGSAENYAGILQGP